MHCQAGTALTMGKSLSLLQDTGIPSSIYNTTHDLWDLSMKFHITMQHAVCSIAFVETEPLKTLPILMFCSLEAHSRRKNPHRDEDLPIFRSRYWVRCCLISLSVTRTLGQSAPSTSLPSTPSCMVWFTCWRQGMPFRGTLTGWRGGPSWTSWSSTRPSARSCT